MKFFLTIDLGNEAMQCAGDLGTALIDLGEGLHGLAGAPCETLEGGRVRDINGNTVGRWEVAA
jgi:hypothetical protein